MARELGDEIERVVEPLALLIDKITGMNISNCKGCKKMKERLNAGMSLSEAIALRIQGK